MNAVLDERTEAHNLQHTNLDDYIALEPRIRALLDEAKSVKANVGNYCANEIFFGYGRFFGRGLKPRILRLVGQFRDSGPELLRTSAAYDAVYRAVYDALPPCRACGCL